MSAQPLLNLGPNCPHVAVFRVLCSVIRDDPRFSATVAPGSFRCWEGKPDDRKPFGLEQAPAVRLTMGGGPAEWFDPTAVMTEVSIMMEIISRGLCSDDAHNLFWALVRAIYPADRSKQYAIQNRLTAAGAKTGLVSITRPSMRIDDQAGGIFTVGQLGVSVLASLNS